MADYSPEMDELKALTEEEEVKKGMNMKKTLLIAIGIHAVFALMFVAFNIVKPIDIQMEEYTDITLSFEDTRVAPVISETVRQASEVKQEIQQREQQPRRQGGQQRPQTGHGTANAQNSDVVDTSAGGNTQTGIGQEDEEFYDEFSDEFADEGGPIQETGQDTAREESRVVNNISEVGLAFVPGEDDKHYPAHLKAQGIEGTVILRIRFDYTGRAHATVTRSSGYAEFDNAAREYAELFRAKARTVGSPDIIVDSYQVPFRLKH